MKRIIGLVLSVMLVLTCVSCGSNKPKDVEYAFYADGSSDGQARVLDGEYLDTSELDFEYFGTPITVDKEKINTGKSIVVDGFTWNAQYVESNQSVLKSSAKDKLHPYGIVDSYRTSTSPNEYARMDVYHQTGQLKDLFIFSEDDKTLEKSDDLTDAMILEKARAAVVQFFGDDALDKYVEGDCTYQEQFNWYVVRFNRNLHGYLADTCFYIVLNHDGEVRKLSANNHYEFDAVENDVTAEMIKNAEVALRAQIPENLTVQEDATKVMIDGNTGKLFLRMYARETPTYDEHGDKIPNGSGFFYVNIE